jgi:hypothetical protein
MANTFTSTSARRFAGPEGKSYLHAVGTLVIDTTATGGATAGDLPASMFGLSEIRMGGHAVLSDNTKVYPTVPAYDRGSLLVVGGASNAPMDLPNGTYTVNLTGFATTQ